MPHGVSIIQTAHCRQPITMKAPKLFKWLMLTAIAMMAMPAASQSLHFSIDPSGIGIKAHTPGVSVRLGNDAYYDYDDDDDDDYPYFYCNHHHKKCYKKHCKHWHKHYAKAYKKAYKKHHKDHDKYYKKYKKEQKKYYKDYKKHHKEYRKRHSSHGVRHGATFRGHHPGRSKAAHKAHRAVRMVERRVGK